jgi:flagellar biosynthetic protein FliO
VTGLPAIFEPVLLLAAPLPGAPAAAELEPSAYGLALLKVAVALVVVCALAYLALRLLRRIGSARRGSEALRVIEQCPLGPRQSLFLVEAAGRVFLLGSTDGGVTRLAEIDPSSLEPSGGGGAPVRRRESKEQRP